MAGFDPKKGGGEDLWAASMKEDTEARLDSMLREDIEGTPSDKLAAKYMNEFKTYESARIYHDDRMILCLRHYHGQYGPEVALKPNESKAFVKLTKTKVKLAMAMISSVLIAPDSWGVESTREPSMPTLKAQLLKKGMLPEDVRKKVKEKADQAAERLQSKVEDTLAENDFESMEARGLLDYCLFGKAVIYGPMVRRLETKSDAQSNPTSKMGSILSRVARTMGWAGGAPDIAELQSLGLEETYGYTIELVRPWDLYFDPIAERVEDCNAIYRRRVMTRSQLRGLLDDKLFDSEIILKLLEDNPDGNWRVTPWESAIAAVDNRNTLQGTGYNSRFVVLERWGKISGRDLRDAGIEVPDSDLETETMAQIWICGDKIIKCESSKLHAERMPFYIGQYDIVPGTMHAEGVAESMMDAQRTINAAEREKNNNMAAVSRPSTVLRPDRLKMGDKPLEWRPGKTWTAKEGNDSEYGKPIEFFDVPSHLDEFLKVQAAAKQWAQEETGLPDFLQGVNSPGTHNRTLGGATLQYQNSLAPLRTVILNWEKQVRVPLFQCIARAYSMFSKDPGIKGDTRVVARGIQRMMAHESFLSKMQEVLQAISAIPGLADRLDDEALGNAIFSNLGISHETFFLSDEAYQQKMQQKAQQEAQAAAMKGNAQGQAEQQFKVETSRRDALIEFAKDSKGTAVYPWVLEEAMDAQDALSPEMKQAIAIMKAEALSLHNQNLRLAQADAESANKVEVAQGRGPSKSTTVKMTHDDQGNVRSVEHRTDTQEADVPMPGALPPRMSGQMAEQDMSGMGVQGS